MATPDAESYQVGWICAVRTEYIVACELLDEEYDTPRLHSNDENNMYTCGRMEGFLVVIACLPKGKYGLTSATTVALGLRNSFPSLRFGLMVGIGGGAPLKDRDIRLGDVVVSCPTGRTGGVIHYEFGKTIQNKTFSPVGHLNSPPRFLLTAVQQLDTLHCRRGHKIHQTIDMLIRQNPRLRNNYSRPPVETDILFRSSYLHQDESCPCVQCCNLDRENTVSRTPRTGEHSLEDGNEIQIHFGLIASADRLMRDAVVRDQLAETEGVLCFEMEAAGLMESFPCLVIRGICDYSDTHKNDVWQGYAAATAAVYAKELIAIVPKRDLDKRPASLEALQKGDYTKRTEVSGPNKIGVAAVLQGQYWTASMLQKMGFRKDAALPASFIIALNNIMSVAEVGNSLSRWTPSVPRSFPYFVAGSFMFPSTIRAITAGLTLEDIVSRMTPATLRGYKRHAVKAASWPAMFPGIDQDEVCGMAIFGLDVSQRRCLHSFQNGMFDLNAATILIETLEGLTAVSAAVYVWNGSENSLIPTEQSKWNPASMLQSEWLQDVFKHSEAGERALEAVQDFSEERSVEFPTMHTHRSYKYVDDFFQTESAINNYGRELSSLGHSRGLSIAGSLRNTSKKEMHRQPVELSGLSKDLSI